MAGGNVGEGTVVDLTGLDGAPLAVDAGHGLAWTGVAVTIDALNEAARGAKLRMPVIPSSSRFATVGGVVSTNAAGARTYRVGPARRWVESATVITADGERTTLRRGQAADQRIAAVQRLGPLVRDLRDHAETIRARYPATRKNTAGYALDAWLDSGDLLDLLIGSEGTLAIVTEVTWRLEPIPPARATARLAMASLDELPGVLDAVDAVGASSVELLDRTFLEFVADRVEVPSGEAVLLIEVEGDGGEVVTKLDHLKEIAIRTGCTVAVARTPAEAAAIWSLRHAASPILASLGDRLRSLQVVEDGAVPRAHLGAYITGVRAAVRRHGMQAVLFGHAGDGHVHVNLLPDVTQSGWRQAVEAIYEEVSALVIGLGGTPSGEHGDGRLRSGLLPRLYGPALMEWFARLKMAFDPKGILNPGIIVRAGPPDWSRLKIDGASQVPEDIAEHLRTIERTGGYATVRATLAESPDTCSRPERQR